MDSQCNCSTKTNSNSNLIGGPRGRPQTKFSIKVTPYLRAINSPKNNRVIEIQFLRALVTYMDKLNTNYLYKKPKSMTLKECFTILGDHYTEELFTYFEDEIDSHASFNKLKYVCECGNEGINCQIMKTIKTMIEKKVNYKDISRYMRTDMEAD